MKQASVAIPLICALFLLGSSASGEPDECVAAFESGQVHRKGGDLLEAKKAFLRCAAGTCPTAMQPQCGKWLDDVNREIPTVVLAASVDGEDVVDVHVDMDGTPLCDTLDVHGIEVEPGEHTFMIAVPGFAPVERRVLLRSGEKLKKVAIALEHAKAAKPSIAARATPAATRPIPTGVFVVGAAGALTLLVGGVFEIRGELARNRLETSCKPDCIPSEVDDIRTSYAIGDTLLAIGGATVAAGAVWYLLRPTRLENASVAIRPGPTSIHVHGSF